MKADKFNFAWLSLLYKCNNKCKWCYTNSNDYEFAKNKILNYEKKDEIINLLKELEIRKVTLIGGEPTLFYNIAEVINKIKQKEMHCGMISNGRRFSNKDFTKQIKDSGLDYVTISIEGSNERVHDEITQIKGSFRESISGLENTIKNGIKTSTNTVIGEKNITDLKNIFRLLKKYPLYNISFNVCGPCIFEDANNQYMVKIQDAINAFQNIYLLARESNIKTRLVTPMPLCNFDKNLLDNLKRDKAIGATPCQLVHGRNFVIDYNGDVIPCTHLTSFPYFNIFKDGKIIGKEEFIENYNSHSSLQFREGMARYASSKCAGCNENCSGGCPLFWTKFNPEKEIKGIRK